VSEIAGTGPAGAVIGNDVLAHAAPPPGRPPVDGQPSGAPPGDRAARSRAIADRTRAATAASMTRSWREIPHYHVATRIDVSRSLRWLDERNAARPLSERVLPAALLLHAVARSARRHPRVNGWWVDGCFRPAPAVDLGVVVALRGGGLVSPTITGADALTLDELMARLHDIVTRARRGRLRSSDAAPASITVTNLGDLGVEAVFGIIHPPQVGLVGFGTVHEEPWAVDGMVGVRPVVHATFAGDHRASDGLAGAAFLRTLGEALQEPDVA
jgi:pyruvate dehydrogenase E2 component (dihydrolipoamide acetyltransferase)